VHLLSAENADLTIAAAAAAADAATK